MPFYSYSSTYRNKKDPHRGRKQVSDKIAKSIENLLKIETKKIPIGDGNITQDSPKGELKTHRNKKDPHRGRKRFFKTYVKQVKIFIETKKIPIGDGNLHNLKE